MKRKQAEERARARREREAENGTLVNEVLNPSIGYCVFFGMLGELLFSECG